MARSAAVVLGRNSFGTDEFIDALKGISPGNLRALWLPSRNDTLTNILKPDGRTWTYGNPGGLISNGDIETNTTGWAGNLGTETLSRDTTESRFGSASLKVVTVSGAAQAGADFAGITVSSATAYTFSAYVWGSGTIRLRAIGNVGGQFAVSAANITLTSTKTRYTISGTSGASDTSAELRILTNVDQAVTFYVDGVRAEAGSTATAFGANVTAQGNGILVSFDGVDQYVSTGDTADLSVGNGTADGPLSIAALVNVTDTAANRVITAKGAFSSGTAFEYALLVNTADALRFDIYDVSSGGEPRRISDAAITRGSLALLGATYSAATGGATAADDMTLYQNGAVIASTATNAAAYVAMENGNAGVGVGQDVGPEANLYFAGSIGFAAIYAAALTAAQHAQIADICRDYYEVAL